MGEFRFFQNCGVKVDSDEQFCHNCGAQLENEVTAQQQTFNMDKKHRLYKLPRGSL